MRSGISTRSTVWPIAGALVATCGAALYWTTLFVTRSDGESLASQGDQLAYNVPALTVLTIASVAAWIRPARAYAGVALLITGLWATVGVTSRIANSWDRGDTLDLAAGILLLASAAMIALGQRVRFRVDRSSLTWAAVATLLAGTWLVGEWMPWVKTTTTFTPIDSTTPQSESTTCCIPYQDTIWQTNVRVGLTMLLLIVAALLLALLTPRSVSGVGLVSLAVLYSAETAAWLQRLANPDVPRSTLLEWGFTSDEINTFDVTAKMSGMLGGWLCLAAVIALILVGIFRALSAQLTTRSPVTTTSHPDGNGQQTVAPSGDTRRRN